MQHNGAPLSCINSARESQGVQTKKASWLRPSSDIYTDPLVSADLQNDFIPEYIILAPLDFSILYILTYR